MSDLTAEPIPFEPPRVRPRIKKLRVLVVAVPLLLLALVSTVFGMMMAVAADVNGLDTTQVFREAHSSRIVDVRGEPLGILSDQNRVVVPLTRVSMAMQNAVVAVEDRRFYSNDGVDVRGIARAFIADLAGRLASPPAFARAPHPAPAITRRHLVLRKMLEQHKLTLAEYRTDALARLPSDVEPPRERAPTPASAYFTTWVRSQVVDRFGA